MTLVSSGRLQWNIDDRFSKEKPVNRLKRLYDMMDCKHKNTKMFEWASLKYSDYDRNFYGQTDVCKFCDTSVRTREQTPDGVLVIDHIKDTKKLVKYR